MMSTENKIGWKGEASIKESKKPSKGTYSKTAVPESCILFCFLLSFL